MRRTPNAPARTVSARTMLARSLAAVTVAAAVVTGAAACQNNGNGASVTTNGVKPGPEVSSHVPGPSATPGVGGSDGDH